jgi:hypothetical protein
VLQQDKQTVQASPVQLLTVIVTGPTALNPMIEAKLLQQKHIMSKWKGRAIPAVLAEQK